MGLVSPVGISSVVLFTRPKAWKSAPVRRPAFGARHSQQAKPSLAKLLLPVIMLLLPLRAVPGKALLLLQQGKSQSNRSQQAQLHLPGSVADGLPISTDLQAFKEALKTHGEDATVWVIFGKPQGVSVHRYFLLRWGPKEERSQENTLLIPAPSVDEETDLWKLLRTSTVTVRCETKADREKLAKKKP